MSSEQNEYQPTEQKPCANNCGFFGSAATMNLCSKCFRDVRIREELANSTKSAVEKSLNPKPEIHNHSDGYKTTPSDVAAGTSERPKAAAAAKNTCGSCNRKVGLMGFVCKCGNTFCGTHRYPEKHGCTFDFKGVGREAIAKANPVVKADKIGRF